MLSSNRWKTTVSNAGGTVDKVEKWGKRKLAYKVDRYREGAYVLFQFSAGQRPTGGDKAVATQKKAYFRRKKVCRFCVEKIDDINYKDMKLLHSFVAERGKIVPRRISGVCAPHQRRLTDAIKKARNIALLPFAAAF